MPPRRSTRTVTLKAAPKAATTKAAAKAPAKAPARGRARVAKRPAAPESDSRTPSPAPPPKRRRAQSKASPLVAEESKSSVESKKTDKSAKSTKSAEKKEKKPAKVVVQKKPYFNALPTPPEHSRPAPLLFTWGAGNFGQFGAGENVLGELEKPTRNKLIEQKVAEGAFGEPGAGLEAVAAGGMFSLFIDEKGTVSSCILTRISVARTDTVC